MSELNKLIHEQTKMKIMSYLAVCKDNKESFTVIKNSLNLTAGNLSVQLTTLEKAGYVTLLKQFVGKKPNTEVTLTALGKTELENYINDLEALLKTLKEKI